MVGQNAFTHESGIHAHAMIKNARAYEPISPELIGIKRSDNVEDIIKQSIILGKGTEYTLKDLEIRDTKLQKRIFMLL